MNARVHALVHIAEVVQMSFSCARLFAYSHRRKISLTKSGLTQFPFIGPRRRGQLTMFLFMMYTGCNLLLLTSPTLALHLPSSPHSTSSAPVPLPTNKTLPALALITPDFSNLTSNYSLGVDRSAPVCDGNLLGFDLNRYSCLQAWNTIPTNSLRLNFGDRLSGTFDVQLPRRFSGRKCVLIFKL